MTCRGAFGGGLPLPKPGRAVQVTVLAATLCFLAVASPAAAQTQAEDLGAIQWPPEAHRSPETLDDLFLPLFANGTQPTILQLHRVTAFQAEPVNETTLRIRIQEGEAGNHTILQQHEPLGPGSHHVYLRPDHLEPAIEIEVNPGGGKMVPTPSSLVRVFGPPGSFDLSGDTAEEKFQDLLEKLDLPDVHSAGIIDDDQLPPPLYDRQKACLFEAPGDSGNGTDGCTPREFTLPCKNCTRGGFAMGKADEEFQAAFGDQHRVSVGFVGSGSAWFTPNASLVAATFRYAYDLNESAILGPDNAKEMAIESLRDQGSNVTGLSDAHRMSLEARLDAPRVEVAGVQYRWMFVVTRGEASYTSFAEVEQDAVTGELRSVDTRRTSAADGPNQDRGLPASPWLAPVAGLLAALAATRRSSPRPGRGRER